MGDFPETLDARCDALGRADAIIVFGTRLPDPAHRAADLFQRGLAPVVVVTGGAARQADGLNEAHRHAQILREAGVPVGAVVVDDRSTHTGENVRFALEALAQREIIPRTVIAVVKEHHRRALVTLAHQGPSIETIYSATYPAPISDERLQKEALHFERLDTEGVDLLVRTNEGWRRTT